MGGGEGYSRQTITFKMVLMNKVCDVKQRIESEEWGYQDEITSGL